MKLTLREAGPEDFEPILELNRTAFGEEIEASLIAALEKGGYVRLSLVAEEKNEIVGHFID